jgi:hypothetical protein
MKQLVEPVSCLTIISIPFGGTRLSAILHRNVGEHFITYFTIFPAWNVAARATLESSSQRFFLMNC